MKKLIILFLILYCSLSHAATITETVHGNLIVQENLTVSGNVTTAGTTTSGDITIFDPTPILVFQDSNSPGAASVGYIEWRDSGGGRAGFLGNNSSGNDDLYWKNEQGGNIGIETTGAGEVQIFSNVDITGTINTTSDDNWDLNDYTAGVQTDTGYVTVTINGTAYKLLARLEP